MKRGTLDDELAALRAVRDNPSAPESLARLKKALGSKQSFAVAAAAEIVGQAELSDLYPLLPPAFDRFLIDAVKSDRGCRAKMAIADALQRAAYEAPQLYFRGIRHVQMEPTWNGQIDTAGGLRGLCGFGLARMEHPEALNELAELLADTERVARADAARAVACAGQQEGIPLLRYKALVGDADPQVMTEVFGSLLALSPSTLPFVARFLHDPKEDVAEAAALAIGESRREGALEVLIPYCAGLSMGDKRSALVAIALVRAPAAIEHLLSLVASEPAEVAAQAIAALGVYRHDDSVRRRVEAAAGARGGRALQQAFLEAFSPT